MMTYILINNVSNDVVVCKHVSISKWHFELNKVKPMDNFQKGIFNQIH